MSLDQKQKFSHAGTFNGSCLMYAKLLQRWGQLRIEAENKTGKLILFTFCCRDFYNLIDSLNCAMYVIVLNFFFLESNAGISRPLLN